MSAAHPQIANRPADDRASGAEVAMELATWSTGLGVITFVLFPLLIPGIAVLALFALPFLPLVLLVPFVLLPLRLVRAARRAARGRKFRVALRTGEQHSLVKRR